MPGINAIIVVAETITFSIPPALGFAPVILNTAIDITKAIIAAIIIIKKGLVPKKQPAFFRNII